MERNGPRSRIAADILYVCMYIVYREMQDQQRFLDFISEVLEFSPVWNDVFSQKKRLRFVEFYVGVTGAKCAIKITVIRYDDRLGDYRKTYLTFHNLSECLFSK